jgi:hypothetical protein
MAKPIIPENWEAECDNLNGLELELRASSAFVEVTSSGISSFCKFDPYSAKPSAQRNTKYENLKTDKGMQ